MGRISSSRLTTLTRERAARLAEILTGRYHALSGHESAGKSVYRTIVVLGAGASHSACGVPLGATLARRVEESVYEKGIPPDLIRHEVRRLEQVFRMRPDDFETRLYAVARFDADTALKALCRECDVSFYPSVTYEIVAHLMKHGFLDAVINFNFDELLDQAIDEEVGADRYTRIVRDGDWIRTLRAAAGAPRRFDTPLYIKPHGTVSEPASLRFTRDAYFSLPPDTMRLLETLISGASAQSFVEGAVGRSRTPVCILVLGHALESFEFNNLLKSCPKGSVLFQSVFDPQSRSRAHADWPDRMQEIAEGNELHLPKNNGLDVLTQEIWADIERRTHDPTRWTGVRDIVRHELIAYLFKATRYGRLMRRQGRRASDDEKLALRRYLRDRFLIEVMLSIAKAKGFVDLRELARGRVGRYYKLYSENAPGECEPIANYLRLFGMERRDTSSEAFWRNDIARTNPATLTLSPARFNRWTVNDLVQRCSELLSSHRQRRFNSSFGKSLTRQTLRAMFVGDEVEIQPAQPATYRFRFKSPRPIRTLSELRRETQALLHEPWQLLLCVAESGEWLESDPIKTIGASNVRKVGVIVADTRFCESLKSKGRCVLSLPWHLHNRHMTVRLQIKGRKIKADRAIYFERRYRSALISPVVLTHSEDLDQVLNDFTVYWLKATNHKEGISEVIVFGPDELKVRREAMLREMMTCDPNSL